MCCAVKYEVESTTNIMQHLKQHYLEYLSNSATNVSQSKPVPSAVSKQQKLKEAFQLKEMMPFSFPQLPANHIKKFIVVSIIFYNSFIYN